jgi:hypothetical protein
VPIIAAAKNYLRVGFDFIDSTKDFETIQSRHREIQQDSGDFMEMRFKLPHRVVPIDRCQCFYVRQRQNLASQRSNRRLIVYD